MGVLDRLVRFFWKEFEKAITQTPKAKRVSQKKIEDKYAGRKLLSNEEKPISKPKAYVEAQAARSTYKAPTLKELLSPADVPAFEELAENKHCDYRALVYAIALLNPQRKWPYSDEEISCLDFGKKSTAYSELKKSQLIRSLTLAEELEARFTKDELLKLVHEYGLSGKGRKIDLANRLVENGYKLDRRKYRGRYFRITEMGAEAIESLRNDEKAAIADAITALKKLDYQEAVAAYRKYDNKWGFVHTSGKVHTIFTCWDVPESRFKRIEGFKMRELNNSENFKITLRACLLAGLMRGCQDNWTLVSDFKSVCTEKIDCPKLLDLFEYDQVILENMRRQIEFSSDNALEYYISHLLYWSRR